MYIFIYIYIPRKYIYTKIAAKYFQSRIVFKLIYSSTHLHNGLEEYVYI